MKKPETKFKERIYPLLKRLPNTWVRKIQQVAIRGIPDFLMCVNGHFVALELKVDGRLERLQGWNIGKIMNAKGTAIVVTPTNWEEVYERLQKMAKEG